MVGEFFWAPPGRKLMWTVCPQAYSRKRLLANKNHKGWQKQKGRFLNKARQVVSKNVMTKAREER